MKTYDVCVFSEREDLLADQCADTIRRAMDISNLTVVVLDSSWAPNIQGTADTFQRRSRRLRDALGVDSEERSLDCVGVSNLTYPDRWANEVIATVNIISGFRRTLNPSSIAPKIAVFGPIDAANEYAAVFPDWEFIPIGST